MQTLGLVPHKAWIHKGDSEAAPALKGLRLEKKT